MNSYSGFTIGSANAYHQNNHLLVQFILSQFMDAFEEISRLQTYVQNEMNKGGSPECKQKEIEASLAKLIGAKNGHMRLNAWNRSEGTLIKLKSSCSLFLQNLETDEKEIITMQHYLEKLIQACIKGMDLLYDDSVSIAQLISIIDKAKTSIQRLSKVMTRIIHLFRDDENLVYCLLTHSDRLDKIYGPQYVTKQIIRIFPKGLQEAQNILINKFSIRGFDHMISSIETKIAKLEISAT